MTTRIVHLPLIQASLEGVFDTTTACHIWEWVEESETGLGRSDSQVTPMLQASLAQSETYGVAGWACFSDEHIRDLNVLTPW
jgi:hypothetical protein